MELSKIAFSKFKVRFDFIVPPTSSFGSFSFLVERGNAEWVYLDAIYWSLHYTDLLPLTTKRMDGCHGGEVCNIPFIGLLLRLPCSDLTKSEEFIINNWYQCSTSLIQLHFSLWCIFSLNFHINSLLKPVSCLFTSLYDLDCMTVS